MAKKARQRISYVLELANSSPGGHRLGVNGLAVDRDNAILYSGGRDGVVCAWDLNLNLTEGYSHGGAKTLPTTRFRTQTHPHTHWINDITLAQDNTALVSASSDLTVKLWRPHSEQKEEPVTIGQHADYVKCVAAPGRSSDWVASGGLDRKIYLWDLNGKGKTLEIDVSGEEITEKGSVYALSVNPSILGSGGPEGTVRLWDPKTGKSITKFVGHTDNVRSILVNAAGDTVITASSDQTVKVWSVTAGRCMHTLTMHNDSVWSLYSDDPELGVFYSSDRSGLIVKTDARGTLGDWDDALSIAVGQEHERVSKVIAAGDYIWTATSRSSINRWVNVDTGPDIELPEPFRHRRESIASITSGDAIGSGEDSLSSSPLLPASSPPPPPPPPATNGSKKKEIPAKAILKISHAASWPPTTHHGESDALGAGLPGRKPSEVLPDAGPNVVEPMYELPEETIEGQFGLVKHRLLNDRRRVLTLDTAGDVLLWDLIKCRPVKSFGKRHLEDVEPEVNKLEAVAPWCSVDISSGNLTVALEPFNCFDAEAYADELVMDEPIEFREDQRINVGKWILRYLFAKLIDEEIKRDEAFRQKLNEGVETRLASAMANPPMSVAIPEETSEWQTMESAAATPRANGNHYPPMTLGMGIAMATPGFADASSPMGPADKRSSQLSRASVEKEDYFSNAISSADTNQAAKPAQTPAPEASAEAGKTPATENGKEKEKEKEPSQAKTPGTPFGKKFRMGMSFGTKKLGRSASSTAPEKPAVVDEKAEESESSSNHEKEFDDSFLGVIQRIRNEYEKQLSDNPDKPVETKVTPSLPSETPVLKLPPGTKVIIQEERSGGSAELYRGTVETVGADADVIEQRAPLWLGDVLLTNTIPYKDPVKVSFVLYPYGDSLPGIATADGNNRLNANRMLRVKKILAYVAERIDPANPEHPDPDALKPEEYLELYCNEQLLPLTMSLATLRAHVWKGGNDIVLYYKANGRKEIRFPPPAPLTPEEPPALPTPVPVVNATAATAAA